MAPRSKRLRWLLAIGSVLALLAAAYVHFFLYLPMGSGPAGPDIDAGPFERRWTERTVPSGHLVSGP